MRKRAGLPGREAVPLRALNWVMMFLLALVLAGCNSGSNGAQGPTGATGATGATGPAGSQGPAGPSASTYGEACVVCHGAGAAFQVANFMGPTETAAKFQATQGGYNYDRTNWYSKPDVAVKNITLTNTGGYAVVNFTVNTTGGNDPSVAPGTAVPGIPASDFTFILADLVPANTSVTDPVVTSGAITSTTSTSYSTSYFEQYAHESMFDYRGNPTTFGTLVDHGDGSYTYTFATAFGGTTTGAGLNNDEYDPTHDQRLAVDFAATATTNFDVNAGIGFLDFSGVPAAGSNATSIISQRQFVTIQACKACHGPHMENAAHADKYPDTRMCVLCHSPLYGSSTDASAHHLKGSLVTDQHFFPALMHQVHSGLDVQAKVTTDGLGNPVVTDANWSDVVFPQEVNNCVVCHSNPAGQQLPDMVVNGTTITDSSGTPDTTVDAWKDHPTRQVCATCHYNVKFDGTSFVGLDGKTKTHVTLADDSLCSGCHTRGDTATNLAAGQPGGLEYVHSAAPKLVTTDSSGTSVHEDNRPEFRVNISMTAPANGSYYVAGEKPVVTVTLDKISYPVDANGNPTYGTPSYTPVDGSVYTTPGTDPTAVKGSAGGGLSSAVLMVYGPRDNALPVLTTDSTTDPNLASGAVPEQEHDLLADSTDPRVTADASGFHYQLQAIPQSLPEGTYMVQAQISDYGGLSNTDYVTGSTGLTLFNVGDLSDSTTYTKAVYTGSNGTTYEAKIDGNGCVNCHGDTRQHQAGTHAHDVPFNTDYCLACHDTSGNYADPIANRVHALHDGDNLGDLKNYTDGVYTVNASGVPARDWSAINFPQNDLECVMCHTSTQYTPTYLQNSPAIKGSGSFLTKPGEAACIICHNDTSAIAHFRQNGGKY